MRASNRDPRDLLRQIDRYGTRPQSLKEWIARSDLSQAEERLYWEFWDESGLVGTHMVCVPVHELARRIGVTESTANRAIQRLISLGLIRRTRQAKLPGDRFREPVALTEVLLPAEVERRIPYIKPRRRPESEPRKEVISSHATTPPTSEPAPTGQTCLPLWMLGLTLKGKLSESEAAAWLAWKRGETASFEFSANSRLNDEERARALAAEPVKAASPPAPSTVVSVAPVPRRTPRSMVMDLFTSARLRQRLSEVVQIDDVDRVFQELAWSIQHGSLNGKQSLLHAMNLGVKLVREGVWTRPRKMPSHWAFQTCQPRDSQRR